MNSGVRYRVQRVRRAVRRAEVRALRPGALCFLLPDGSRVVADGAEDLARADTSNQAWWAAWCRLFPAKAIAVMYPRRRVDA